MKSFDRAARRYESFAHIQRAMAAWLAEWLPKDRTGTAVEVGAGTGIFTRHLTPWPGRLIATDASTEMMARGNRNCAEAEWRIATADRLPNVSADWIFSSSFLQWVGDSNKLFRHWKTRLEPKGRVLAGLFVAPTLRELYEVLPESAPLQWRTTTEWKTAVQTAGFRVVREEARERVFTFSASIDLLRNLHGIGAAPARRVATADLRQAMREYDVRFGTGEHVHSTWMFYKFEATPE